MQRYRRRVAAVPAVRVSTVVWFLTGGLVGAMAYHGSLAPVVWVLAVLVGLSLRDRVPRPEAAWRGAATAGALFVSGGLLGALVYGAAFGLGPWFAAACLAALVLAPADAV